MLLSLVLLLMSGQAARSQPPALARVETVAPAPAQPGASVSLVVRVTPRKGIHIYAPPQKEFKPISLTVDPIPGGKVGKPQYPPAATLTFEGEAVKVYDKAFSIVVPIVLPARGEGAAQVAGELLYQACDDLVCYRPVTTAVRWEIPLR